MSLELKLKEMLYHIKAKPNPFDDTPYWRKLNKLRSEAIDLMEKDRPILEELWADIKYSSDYELGIMKARSIIEHPTKYYPFLGEQLSRAMRIKKLGKRLIEIAEEYFRTLKELREHQLEYYERVEAPWWDKFGRLKQDLPKPIQDLISFVYGISSESSYAVIVREICRTMLEVIKLVRGGDGS